MYNSNKPNKFAVEFFLLCDSEHYFIAHIDVYQGKESHEMYVDDRAKGLQTTMKALMNAVFKRGLDMDPSGQRYLLLTIVMLVLSLLLCWTSIRLILVEHVIPQEKGILQIS